MRDRLERCALKLWRRWLRMARYALKTTRTDALLRFRIRNHQEVSKAVEDVLAGREGLVHMLVRARRTARSRMRTRIESEVVRVAMSIGVGSGRTVIARAVERAGYRVGDSTVRRVLERRGLWSRKEAEMRERAGVRDRGRGGAQGSMGDGPYKTRPPRPSSARCAEVSGVRKEEER